MSEGRMIYSGPRIRQGVECMKRISREINGERIEVKIYTSNRSRSENDKEMDARAISAVHEAINRAKVTNKPIARFDSDENKPYLEYPNGKRVYG